MAFNRELFSQKSSVVDVRLNTPLMIPLHFSQPKRYEAPKLEAQKQPINYIAIQVQGQTRYL